jgi:tetratricopeptide (TPR) repeat protein
MTSGAASGTRLQQVANLYQQGNLPAASQLAGQLLRITPNDAALLEISAAIALQSGDPQQAIELFNRQLKVQPGNALAHSNLCMALHAAGNDEAAFEHGQQAILIEPGLADAWNNLGNIYESGNNLARALEHYEKALSLDDSDPRVHLNAGSVSQLLGDLDTAESHYREALKIYPAFASAYNNLGTVLLKQKRYDEAEQSYQQAMQLQSDNPEILTNYAAFLLDRNELDKAQEFLEKAIELNPKHAGAWVTLGNLSDKRNDPESVERYYDKALLLDPENSTVRCNLGYRHFELGNQKQAVEQFVRALKRNPNSAKALAGLGKAMLRQDETDKAAEYIDKALKLSPWDVHAHIAEALLHERQRDFNSAETEWKYALEQQPDMSEAYIGLAGLYSTLGRYDEARAIFLQAEQNNAASLGLYHAWSTEEEKVHRLDAAEQLAEKAVELDPDYPGLAILKAKLARRRKDFSGALALLDQIDSETIENKQIRANYLFERGALLDKLGRFTEAFAAYDDANQTKNEYVGHVYKADQDEARIDRWKLFFTAEHLQALTSLSTPVDARKATPVFIVGFPRSGTSLLEQILGSHPNIAPAGELSFISDLANFKASEINGSKLPWPDLLLDDKAPLDTRKLQAMQDYYLGGVDSLDVIEGSTRWVTDKMPHNAVHVGLISVLFPTSPIIHISRHPLNSCLSAFFSDFKSVHRYTSSLASTARHYKQVMSMLEHYRSAGIGVLEIHYEDLVTDPENTIRKVLEYLGAPWDDACLQHHKSQRVVKTASYEQVTQKIYTSSLYRYRDYHEAVQPIIPILSSTIERYGYFVE